jgi:hypothetical protein
MADDNSQDYVIKTDAQTFRIRADKNMPQEQVLSLAAATNPEFAQYHAQAQAQSQSAATIQQQPGVLDKANELAGKALGGAGLPTSLSNVPDWFKHLTGTHPQSEPFWEPIRQAIKNPTQENIVGAVPFVGPAAVSMSKDVQKGNYAGAAATAAGTVGAVAGAKQVGPGLEARSALKESGAPSIPQIIGEKAGLPSASAAGETLNKIKKLAGDIPIDMKKPGNTALQIYEQSQRGTTLPTVVRKFIQRATSPDEGPITYAEAKDFQSNVSGLSAAERMKMSPKIKMLLGQLNADLKESLTGAAGVAGKADEFTKAMGDYHKAMQIKAGIEWLKETGVKAALGGAAGAAGYEMVKKATGNK